MKRLLVLFAVLVPLSLLIVGCGQQGGYLSKPKVYSGDEQKKMESTMKAKFQATKGPEGPKGKGFPGATGGK